MRVRRGTRATWIRVENTHEPIISMDVWDRAQQRLGTKSRSRKIKADRESLFSGVIRCADCHSALAYMTRPLKGKEIGAYRCSRYNNNGGGACSTHYIQEDVLAFFVLNDIRAHAQLALKERVKLADKIKRSMNGANAVERRTIEKQLRKVIDRLSEIDEVIGCLYEDKCFKRITEDFYHQRTQKLQQEQDALKNERESLQNRAESVRAVEEESRHG